MILTLPDNLFTSQMGLEHRKAIQILPTDPPSWRGQGWHWRRPEVAGQRRLCQTLRLQGQEDLGVQLLGVEE